MARQLKDTLPSPEELLQLEPEEVAVFLLDYLCDRDEQKHGHLDRYSFTLDDNIMPYAGDKTKEVGKLIMEAWCWLEKEGMLAPTPGNIGGDWMFVTRRGFKLRDRANLEAYKKGHFLPRENLDESLLRAVYPLFIRGDYDMSVLRAYKEVEVRVREKAGLPADLVGVNLMRRAFNPEDGPLSDMEALPAERQAASDLFAGSIGLFKNPFSHRKVNLDYASEAAEIILFANYLLRLIERCNVNTQEK